MPVKTVALAQHCPVVTSLIPHNNPQLQDVGPRGHHPRVADEETEAEGR